LNAKSEGTVGEIKSTLELAMERTKKLSISEKEKEEIKQKEGIQKATSLFHRYREGHLPLHEIQKEMDRMEEKAAKTVKQALLTQWIDALSLNEDDERIFKGIEWLKEKESQEVKQEFLRLLSQYQREKEKVKEEVGVQLTEALRRDGIYGSAIELKIEGSEFWKKEIEKLDSPYRMKLKDLKDQLKSL
jgi:nucleotidyltransferase/DNA polymerase involved in DNA repair